MVALWLLSLDTAALANGRAEKESGIRDETAHFKSDTLKVLPSPDQNRRLFKSSVQKSWLKQFSVSMLLKQTGIQDEFTAARKFYFTSNQKLACALQHFATQSAPLVELFCPLAHNE